MFTEYNDILKKIAEPPLWWDENRVPRYVEFAPQYIADIYSDEAALINGAILDVEQYPLIGRNPPKET